MILSITIDDAKLDEVKTALGNGVLLTNVQAKAAVIKLMKDYVLNYQENATAITNQAAVDAAIATQRNAMQSVAANVAAIAIT